MADDRPMLLFVSDIHLTDQLHGAIIPRAATFERFWVRIQASRGQRPAELCFVGDLFDLVRSPSWFDGAYRPYHEPSPGLAAKIEAIIDQILVREEPFFSAIRERVESGALKIHYVLGNHDRLLRYAPEARRKVWKALTGEDRDVEFPTQMRFPDHGVIAYHGNASDSVNYDADGGATIGDAIGSELITRFPRSVRLLTGEAHAELDDIDDVRPVYAVPAWVRQLGVLNPALLRPVNETWSGLVESFLSRSFVKGWMKEHKRNRFALGEATKLKLLLELSTRKVVAKGSDKRLTELYKFLQHGFDGKMSKHGVGVLADNPGFNYIVNGHSHFATMVPLGNVGGKPAVYFNTGTWRSVHQIGHGLGGRPTFLPYDAMSYLVFFPDGDELGRAYEWWTGAMIARTSLGDA